VIPAENYRPTPLPGRNDFLITVSLVVVLGLSAQRWKHPVGSFAAAVPPPRTK
jgi:hypothetical protein